MDHAAGNVGLDGAPSGTKLFAWAGLRFHIPAMWETGQLTRDHGWLESDFKPVLEFKTAVIKGRFSFRRHLKQLEQSSPLRLHLSDPPAMWRPYLKAFQTQAFSWQGPRLAGDGLAVYCPVCRRATLLQFYRTGRARDDVTPLIASFDDHGPERRPTVAVYDFQVAVPDALPLQRFQFDSGRFELVFGDRRKQLILWRWSPAGAALRRHDGALVEFARHNGLPSTPEPLPAPRAIRQGLEWRWPVRRSWCDRLPRPFQRHWAPGVFRIWHRKTENRILGALGNRNLEYETFAVICQDYEIIP
jgi:hypothetical protein